MPLRQSVNWRENQAEGGFIMKTERKNRSLHGFCARKPAVLALASKRRSWRLIFGWLS